MKLKTLAEMASKLPDLNFDFAGVEHWHDEVFDRDMKSFKELKDYVDKLRNRFAEVTEMLHKLTDAYQQLKDVILEAEVEDA